MKISIRLLSLLLIFSTGSFYSQNQKILKGKPIDSLSVGEDITETYTLYYPTSLDANSETWPVMYVFDPKGQGRLAAQLFRELSEKESIAIIASNSRIENGSLQDNLKIARRLLESTFSSYPINENAVYVSGLAEGAQLACAIPLVYNRVSGVIAVGDAYVIPDNALKIEPKPISLVAPIESYKLYDLEKFQKIFEKRNHGVDLSYYHGNSEEWPVTTMLSNAFAGIKLHEFRENSENLNPDTVEKYFRDEIAFTQKLEQSGQYYESFVKLKQLQEKYKDLGYKDELKKRLRVLKKNKVYRQQRNNIRLAELAEKEKRAMYSAYLEYDILTLNYENVGWWAQEVSELKRLEESKDPAVVSAALRLQDYLRELSKITFKNIANSDASIDTKILTAVLRTALDKQDPDAYLYIIRVAGQDGDYETALLYLEDLLKTGYSNMESLYDIDGILDLTFTKEYNDIIQSYLGGAKYYKAALD